MQTTASMDCGFHVVVHVVNDGTQAFHGQTATADSWIVKIELGPGASTDATALFTGRTKLSGYVQGKLDDGTFVNNPWTAARPADCAAPPTTTTQPVDTTPHPVTIGTGPVVCIVPGSPTQEPVPCDSPRATTPDPPATTAPVVTTPATEAPVASDSPVVTGPPRTHAHVAQTVAHAQPATLPETGPGLLGPELAIAGLCGAIGVVLVRLTTRRHATS